MTKTFRSSLIFLLFVFPACTPKAAPPTGVPRFGHVFIVVLQDHGLDTVIGNPVMPYFNKLASQYTLLTNYSTEFGLSLDNSLVLSTGAGRSNTPFFRHRLYFRNNVVRELRAAGLTWKSYNEGLPRIGYTKEEGFNTPYVKRHNPFAYLADVWLSPSERQNIVPFTQFSKDLSANALPNFSWIVPTSEHNAHMDNCPDDKPQCTDAERLAECDRWLRINIPQLIASDTFQKDGLLIIVFDDVEGNRAGKVPAVIISPFAKRSYRCATPASHAATLKLMLSGLGISKYPGAADTASDLSDCFDLQAASAK